MPKSQENLNDLIMEVGVEELPARFARSALNQLERLAAAGLAETRLTYNEVLVWGTPRRLAIKVRGLASTQADRLSKVAGPPRKIAFDEEGNPTKAAIGFARGAGVPVENLQFEQTDKGEYVFAEVHEKGRPALDVLPDCLASWIEGISFPKTMVWNHTDFRFARPIRWVLALLGDALVQVAVAGVSSSKETWGHRFLGERTEVSSADRYAETLKNAGVIVDQNERRRIIEDGLEQEASKLGGVPIRDEKLLDEVTFLVELPTVVSGAFDPSFTGMPKDVVVTAMREHQRYFAVTREDGSLLPHFIAVLNVGPEAVSRTIKGNERVLEARLADARFYWDLDTKKSFDLLLDGLKGVVWHEGLGSLYDKSQRLKVLAGKMADAWCPGEKENVERAALFCKADLASEMVKDGKEFTGLQGAIGGEYAREWGESPEVAEAIRDHYLPRFAGDVLPRAVPGAILSVADRVDNIVGGFAAGKIPTGSEDPYALRRAANGVVRILLELKLHASMGGLFRESCGMIGSFGASGGESLLKDVLDYWVSRGDAFFADKDVPYDIADAVLSVSFDDPIDSWKRCEALIKFRADENFAALVIGSKRAANILRDTNEGEDLVPDANTLGEEAERELATATETAWGRVEDALSRTDYDEVISTQLGLRPAIDRFFDDVMVMDPDQNLRATRLAILRKVHALFMKTWDLSKIALET
jgi:glycyl-tRNA synthetase beta chain